MYQRPDGLYEKGLTINGKRIRFRGKTEKEILQKIAQYEEKEENGPLFTDVADAWASKIQTEIELTTWNRAYKPLFNRINDYYNDIYVKDISAVSISSFLQTISNYSQKSVRNHLSIIKQILDFAVINGDISHNSAIYIKVPKNLKPAQKRNAISAAEMEKINNGIGYPLFGLYGYLLMYTGLRRGEALALKWADINFERKVISVTRSVYHISNNPEIKSPKTESGIREVFIVDKLYYVLIEYSKNHKADEFIFSTNGGISPLTKSQVAKGWDKYAQTIGIDNVTPHQLRHTYASILYSAGIQAKSAQMLMGHSDISTTQNIYTHLMADIKKDDCKKLNDYFTN